MPPSREETWWSSDSRWVESDKVAKAYCSQLTTLFLLEIFVLFWKVRTGLNCDQVRRFFLCLTVATNEFYVVLVDFQYDNVLMEEAAQILEIETFIPLLLQVINLP